MNNFFVGVATASSDNKHTIIVMPAGYSAVTVVDGGAYIQPITNVKMTFCHTYFFLDTFDAVSRKVDSLKKEYKDRLVSRDTILEEMAKRQADAGTSQTRT